MTQNELHNIVLAKVRGFAEHYGLKKDKESTKQNFLLGEMIPNPDNLVQEMVWKDGDENFVTFRHRFSNICASIKMGKVFAEVEYNLNESGEPCISETMTYGGRMGLILLNYIIDNINIA